MRPPRYQSRSFQPIVVGSSVGSSAADGSGARRRLEVALEHVAGRAARGRPRCADRGERGTRLSQRPAGPPAHVRLGGGPEGREPAAQQLDLRRGDVELLDRPAEPVLGRDPAELGADPRPARPAADEPALHRHLRKHARSRALLDHPPPGAEAELLREQRHVPARPRCVIASPRAATAATAALPARVIQAPGRVETPLSRTKPSSRFRCVAATACVAAAKTTGTSSRGTRPRASAASRACARGSAPRTARARRRSARRRRCAPGSRGRP